MRKLVFILLALLAGIDAEAQETLIPINEETISIEEYDREIERLLVPANTEFGMNCIPSFDVECCIIRVVCILKLSYDKPSKNLPDGAIV